MILDSAIKTQDPGEIADFSFADDSVINKVKSALSFTYECIFVWDYALTVSLLQVILRSEFLKEILDEIDSTSEFIGIELSDSYPYFRFFMSSRLGESEVCCLLLHLCVFWGISMEPTCYSSFQFQVEKTSDMIEFFDCKMRTAFR